MVALRALDQHRAESESLRSKSEQEEHAVPFAAVDIVGTTGSDSTTPSGRVGVDRDPVKLKLDLHDIYNKGDDIDRALRAIIDEAIAKKVKLVEIIPGKGSGQLKKHVLRFLDQKEIKALYDRVEKDSHNFGRVFIHFRFKK